MSEEEQLSPEEKLLKVIQEPEAAADDGPPSTVEAKAVPAEEKPKLEMKKAEDGGQKTEDGEQEAEASDGIKLGEVKLGAASSVPETGGTKIGVGAVLVEDKKKVMPKLGIRTVNKYILAAAIIVLCFVAWEGVSYQLDWQHMDQSRKIEYGTVDGTGEQVIDTSGEGIVDIEKVLSAFRKNPIVSFPGKVVQAQRQTTTTTVVNMVPQTDWAKYARENLKVKGRSRLPDDAGYMAVVSDAKIGQLYFLKAGDKLLLEKQQLEVKEVGAKFIKVSDGGIEITVE